MVSFDGVQCSSRTTSVLELSRGFLKFFNVCKCKKDNSSDVSLSGKFDHDVGGEYCTGK